MPLVKRSAVVPVILADVAEFKTPEMFITPKLFNDSIIGVGTGSTANFFIDYLATIKTKFAGAVASSDASAERLKKLGIEVLDCNSVSELVVYVDGADEVTRHMAMVKGGGGALTREKIVAAVAMRADEALGRVLAGVGGIVPGVTVDSVGVGEVGSAILEELVIAAANSGQAADDHFVNHAACEVGIGDAVLGGIVGSTVVQS